MEVGKEQTFDVEPETGFWKRFGNGFYSVILQIVTQHETITNSYRRAFRLVYGP